MGLGGVESEQKAASPQYERTRARRELTPGKFTEHNFQTASEYFEDLATQQFLHLKYQRNGAVEDKCDCRRKYIARCLFRRIAREIPTEPGPFHLYCDDFRPSNVFVSGSELTVTGVIDWEFTVLGVGSTAVFGSIHAASSALPTSPSGAARTNRFRKVLRESQGLSGRMERSLENGLFWFCLAAKKSFMFDDIYWTFIHERCFGCGDSMDDLVSLLTEDERSDMDGFVQTKMQEAKAKTLDEDLSFDEVFTL